jgi:hypothetical protein
VSGFRAKLASPASAGTLFVLTLAADVGCVPLAVLARHTAGNNLIFLAAMVLLALVLGGVGLVLLATHVLSFRTPVAVAAATLAAAALVNPLRRRVQQFVDRRFNRARYDADQTITAFAARLKDMVDLDSVRDDLASVVDQALEPAHVSVWISRSD